VAEKEGELRNAGVQFIMLDRTLAAYGRKPRARGTCSSNCSPQRIIRLAGGGKRGPRALSSGAGMDLVQRDLFAMSPQTEKQRWLQSHALEITNTLSQSRWDDHRADRQPLSRGRSLSSWCSG
jgi:hypothetical protein